MLSNTLREFERKKKIDREWKCQQLGCCCQQRLFALLNGIQYSHSRSKAYSGGDLYRVVFLSCLLLSAEALNFVGCNGLIL